MKAGRLQARGAGFTLIELSVAAAIGVLVMAAVVAAFAGGLRVWERLRGGSSDMLEAALAIEWLQRDVHNVTGTRCASFEGRTDALRMPVLVAVPGQAAAQSLIEVTYAVRKETRTFERRWMALPAAGESPGDEALITGVESVAFAYRAVGGGDWQPSWSSATNRPGAVSVAIRLGPDRGNLEIRRTIVIPGV
jgi:prepilin-type N-terminal cleavage/methylation domain-containing protein